MKMNLPNKLTILRILLIPVFVFFMLGHTGTAGWEIYGSAGGQAAGLFRPDLSGTA